MRINSAKTSLFLIELIIAILFFSLAAAICVQLFVRSKLISEDSVDLNNALLLTQNCAEVFYGTNGDLFLMKERLDSITNTCEQTSSQELLLTTDDSLKVHITISEKDALLQCDIRVTKTKNLSEQEVYTLSTSLYPKGN